MPLYPYRCTSCGHRFEKIQSFSSEPEKVCPNCGKETLVRPLTAPRFQFKGAGWYVNDYASKGSESAESSTESKPAESKESGKQGESSAASSPSPAVSPAASASPAPAPSSTPKASSDS